MTGLCGVEPKIGAPMSDRFVQTQPDGFQDIGPQAVLACRPLHVGERVAFAAPTEMHRADELVGRADHAHQLLVPQFGHGLWGLTV